MAKITLIGMHNYTDEALWEGLTFPTGFDKSVFIDTVLLHYGEMETLYADPDMMQYAITAWGKRNYWGINKAITAINISYEPLWNYDRHETRTGETSETGTHSVTGTGTSSETSSYGRDMTETTTTHNEGNTTAESDTTTTTTRTESGTVEHTVSAYDSSSYSADNKDVSSNSMNETVTANSESSGTSENDGTETRHTLIDDDSETSGSSSKTEQGSTSKDREESETMRAWGNIGVTTSQQMLRAELDLSLYNIYDTFAGIFACDLLLMIY